MELGYGLDDLGFESWQPASAPRFEPGTLRIPSNIRAQQSLNKNYEACGVSRANYESCVDYLHILEEISIGLKRCSPQDFDSSISHSPET
jgi:hypothetical protein